MALYQLIPQDVLFFRDARPMTAGAGSGGHGARWPDPSLIFDALHAALHRAFPLDNEAHRAALAADSHEWEHAHRMGRSSHRDFDLARTQRFGSLVTAGLFPSLGEKANLEWLFPCPADIARADAKNSSGQVIGAEYGKLMPVANAESSSDLPSPLRYVLASPLEPSKTKAPEWWTKKAWEAYLNDVKIDETVLKTSAALFSGEWTTGIGMKNDVQDGERIYSAEYLRLRPGVSMGFAASLPSKSSGGDDLTRLFGDEGSIIVGGQQRVCSVHKSPTQSLSKLLPVASPISGRFVKWTLLSPCVFPSISKKDFLGRPRDPHPGGWLPNWIFFDAANPHNPGNGKVLLRSGPGEKKAARKKTNPGSPIGARLVAACVPKPVVLSGWSERLHLQRNGETSVPAGARETRLAVPAGAAYYFAVDPDTDPNELAKALNWHGAPGGAEIVNRRSTLLGEKGFGLGVCSGWKPS